ncbi:hypothetical protein ACKAV7_009750 [Fusarium commune]
MDPIGDSHGFPRDVLPPEGAFSSREELVRAINAWAAPRGYAFISQRSFHQLANAGIAPKEIRSYLRTTSDTLATQQDIYNCIARGKRDLAKGQSNIHALADQLNSEGFWSEIRLDEGGRVTAVLFAHPQSLEYLKLYPEVLLLDFGIDACQRSFCIAFAFLSGEEENDFIWALERLRHIPKGQEEWKQFYDLWHEIVASPTEDIYNERLKKLKKHYLPMHIEVVGYILETWLDPHKQRFVKAWVHQHLHFEQFVTSRAEGIHQLIKSHLKHSQVDLFEAWRIIKLVLSNQLSELKANQAKQQITTPLDISGVLYGNIRGWISHEALRKVDGQRARLLKEIPACTGVFAKTLSLPCAYNLQPLLAQGLPLQLYHFHSHWHLQRSGTPQLIVEPRKLFDRLAANSTLPSSSTQREPSAFEAIEKASQLRALPKCSRCHDYGHKMTSKACPLRYEDLLEPPPPITTTTHTVTHTATRSVTRSLSPSSPSGVSVISEIVAYTTTHMTTHTTTHMVSPPTAKSAAITTPCVPVLQPDDPCAIFQRYKEAREAWYATLPQGGLKTNQQYRRAMGLPQRYSKAEYNWCLDYKQMGRRCRAGTNMREWTKEEMMSYLDWDKAEDERVEQNVRIEMAKQPFSRRRGMQDIWDAAERDLEVHYISSR